CMTLCGNYNVYNLLGASALLHELCGISLESFTQLIQTFPGVPGRMEHYTLPNGALGVIDYAHNPSSFEAVLSTLATMTNHLIVVFGAGGERDKEKRPIMGAIAARYCQYIVLTSDNPRSENPYTIICDIISGIDPKSSCIVDYELDRSVAIKKAYDLSKEG